MAPVRTPRRTWVDQGLKALAQGGPEAVRVEVLAQSLGVTKGGFYGFFADRRALLEEMLDAWEEEMIDEVIDQVESGGGDARAKLKRLFALAGTSDARELLAADLAIRDWARRDRAVARRLRRVDDRRMSYMRSLFADFCPSDEDVEVRCMIAFSLWIGNHFIAAGHAGLSREKVMALTLERLEL
jgi:AcrR family transcriptional regulator